MKNKPVMDLTQAEISAADEELSRLGEQRGVQAICNEENLWDATVGEILEISSLIGYSTGFVEVSCDDDETGCFTERFITGKVIDNFAGTLRIRFDDGSVGDYSRDECTQGFWYE